MKNKDQTQINNAVINEKEHNDQSAGKNASSRRSFMKQSLAASAGVLAASTGFMAAPNRIVSSSGNAAKPAAKITDLKCAIMGGSAVVRITTDQGISGYGQGETSKPYLKPYVLFYKDYLVGEDPTNVSRILLKIRRLGSFKPWGAAVSAIEIALWDLAGKLAGLPVYKLLGGKMRDQVRCYNGSVPVQRNGDEPKDYIEWGQNFRKLEQGFTIVKQAVGFHGHYDRSVPNFSYNNTTPSASPKDVGRRGPMTEHGLNVMLERVAAMKEGLGEGIGLALDCGPGMFLSDAIRLANALEPFNLMWCEDMLTGDYTPYVLADDYVELTRSTTTPIHTGEQLYLRENCRELIEKHAVRILGPDPEDIGGIAELKWIAEYADLHSIQIAPHGVIDGLIGVAAQVMVGAAMPENYIAFEYCQANPAWWYDIISGLPDPIVKGGLIDVWDRPGLGIEIDTKAAKQYLAAEDKNFFA
ncbi:MAG: mandelate racemase/muconate lactonizing enzyme family protein [Cyclobacteriaceae bacterium]|nr:mandelate racemase/muconate lactonizing enzyme family protein [Cyclobacteriaceae bacterium]MDH4297758.1 mandelate racemase/muconate lactonizing enzyme family protein [Cyclobacteriaceae bacterium]MDH5249467.1 mandelate racemase/muconate lactonizing enzyme family protein [Cyclobacteriaceae bacterium]